MASKIPQEGDRIRVLAMPDDINAIPVGTEGVVVGTFYNSISGEVQIDVDWANGRSLMLLSSTDDWEIIGEEDSNV